MAEHVRPMGVERAARGTHWQRLYRELRESRAASYWLRSALAAAMDRDPVDALADAEQLVAIQRARLDELQAGGDGLVEVES